MSASLRYGNRQQALTYFSEFNLKANQAMKDLPETDFSMYLLKATRVVDDNIFVGVKESATQQLEFPRVIYKDGEPITPDYIKYATYETAYSLYKAKNDLSNISVDEKSIKSQSLDSMRVEYFEGREKVSQDFLPEIAKIYLKKYILNKSTSRAKVYPARSSLL